jgi:hypothetical protein
MKFRKEELAHMSDLVNAKAFVNKLDIVQMAPDELAHYGVLGMRWGKHLPGRTERSHNPRQPRKVRFRDKETGTTTKKKYPVNASNDYIQSRELKTKPTHQLSNSEIQDVINRLQKEQKLKQLDPSNVARGKKIVLGTVAAMGVATTIYNFTKSDLGRASISRGAKVVNAILKKTA